MTGHASRMPLDAALDDDGETPCQPPDDCPMCSLFPRPGEDREAHIRRLGDLYRLAPKAPAWRREGTAS